MENDLLQECGELGSLASVAIALVQYATSLGVRSYTKKGNRYVADPNFVTFQVHHLRAKNLTISLRGNPEEFLQVPELVLKKSQNGYSEIKVAGVGELLAAANSIARAKEVFVRGRTRAPRTLKVVEV